VGISVVFTSLVMKILICWLVEPLREKLPLDGFSFLHIIGRNTTLMNPSLFILSIIVIVLAVLIIKDPFVVGMAPVRVKKK
jgi:hypothetical protein